MRIGQIAISSHWIPKGFEGLFLVIRYHIQTFNKIFRKAYQLVHRIRLLLINLKGILKEIACCSKPCFAPHRMGRGTRLISHNEAPLLRYANSK